MTSRSGRQPRVAMLTSTERRHRYAASLLASAANVVGVVAEAKLAARGGGALAPNEADAKVLGAHFAERDAAERRIFGEANAMPSTDVLEVKPGEVNSPAVFDWVQSRAPDFVVLFGTAIVRPPLLDLPGVPLINVHLGLSPYYRGAGTNFWPLYRGEPECVGATIHVAVQKVDAGPILAQVRPEAEPTDRAHDLGSKTIREAFHLLPAVLDRCAVGGIDARPQELGKGTVYKKAQFSADAVRVMWTRFDDGMMEDYLADRLARNARFPIVDMA